MKPEFYMENKKYCFAAAVFTFILFNTVAFAQIPEANTETAPNEKSETESPAKNYFLRESEDGVTLIQRLSWENIEDIFGYEFILEQKDNSGKWKNINVKRTEENFVDVSLPPGNYRYKVVIINLLEQKEGESTYRYFDVRIAYQPEVASVYPQTIYFDDIYEDTITVSGKNFYKETQFALAKDSGGYHTGEVVELDTTGTNAKIKFNMTRIIPGTYNVQVTDVSGLRDNKQAIVFKFQKPVDFYISAGYAFSGFIQNAVFKEFFNADYAALGANVRMTLIPIKRNYGTFGFNITGSGMYLHSKRHRYKVKAGYLLGQLNCVYLIPIIRHRLNFDIHLGAGAAFLVQTQFSFPTFKSPVEWFWGLTVNGGTALQIYLVKKLYLEINLDHIIAFKKSFPLYTIQPSLSLGWEF